MSIGNEDTSNEEKLKEEDFMAALAKPNSKVPVVSAEKSPEFIKKSNEKKITKVQLENYRKSSAMFKKNF